MLTVQDLGNGVLGCSGGPGPAGVCRNADVLSGDTTNMFMLNGTRYEVQSINRIDNGEARDVGMAFGGKNASGRKNLQDALPNPILAIDGVDQPVRFSSNTGTLVRIADFGRRWVPGQSVTLQLCEGSCPPATATTDTTAPTVASIVRAEPMTETTNADSLTWRVSFSEPVINVDAADFALTGTTSDGRVFDTTATVTEVEAVTPALTWAACPGTSPRPAVIWPI